MTEIVLPPLQDIILYRRHIMKELLVLKKITIFSRFCVPVSGATTLHQRRG